MHTFRFRVAGLMGAVLVIALGLAALRDASETWAGMTFLLTCGVLCLAIVGIVCGGIAQRPWWLGFALFGWGYLALAFWSARDMPMMALLDVIGSRLGVTIQFLQSGMGGGGMVGCAVPSLEPSIREIGRCFCVLLAALLGGVIANAIFGCGRIRLEKLDTDPPATSEISGRWRRSPAVVVPAASVLILALGWFASRSVPGLWAARHSFRHAGCSVSQSWESLAPRESGDRPGSAPRCSAWAT